MHHTVQSSPFRSWGMSFKRFHLWKRPELNGKPIYNYSSWLDVQRHLNKHSFYIYQLNRCPDKDYNPSKRCRRYMNMDSIWVTGILSVQAKSSIFATNVAALHVFWTGGSQALPSKFDFLPVSKMAKRLSG